MKQDIGNRIFKIGYRKQDVGNRKEIGYMKSNIGNWI